MNILDALDFKTMNAKDFKRVILFMGNQWDKPTAQKIFGTRLGEHFWAEWCLTQNTLNWSGGPASTDYATMTLFYKMTNDNLQKLIDYVEANYEG
jgi:hypothetical protein